MSKKEKPWYRDGLRFSCTACGDCCTGAPGYVWFNREEGAAMAKELRLEIDEFYSNFARKIGIRYSLKEYSNGDCVFFNNQSRKCEIYDHRPMQCRTWPFWGSNLKTEDDWREVCSECPGSGKGQLYSLTEIESEKAKVRV